MVSLTLHPDVGGDELQTSKAAFKQLVSAVESDAPASYPAHVSSLTVSTTLRATLGDICSYFVAASASGLGLHTARTKLLSTLLSPTDTAFAGVRWSLLPLPIPLVQRRDLCYTEYFDTFVTAQGRVGFARALHSIKDTYVPLQGCTRARVYDSGLVFRELGDSHGVFTVTLVLNVDFGGHLPQWAVQAAMQSRVKHIYKLETLLRRSRCQPPKRLGQKGHCFHCARPFRFYHKPRHCNECGESFCKKCCDETCTDCRVCVFSPSSMLRPSFDTHTFRSRLESSRSAYSLYAPTTQLDVVEASSLPEGRLKAGSIVDLSYLADFAPDEISHAVDV
ncbi:hypothetical protein ACHHYP_09311 [Achlya hypogyna]|uniref:START domain-containing protein n=1 Tax=Achlya hypogyna TaxID=1202772 RepID=A0A1V9YNN1_ACHHY|nr:hypothetical protein ACHHYP_09311 [Achlya hypogyna]